MKINWLFWYASKRAEKKYLQSMTQRARPIFSFTILSCHKINFIFPYLIFCTSWWSSKLYVHLCILQSYGSSNLLQITTPTFHKFGLIFYSKITYQLRLRKVSNGFSDSSIRLQILKGILIDDIFFEFVLSKLKNMHYIY